MADIEDNYVIAGASGDNLDCDDTSGWTEGGNASAATTQDNKIEGDKSLGLQTSDTGDCWWTHSVSSGNRFKITDVDLGLWFYYIKGKGDNFLVQNNTAVVMRLYFGGDDGKYADYRLTEKGDLSLAFGWQMLMCSGKEMKGGSTSSGHNGGSDWYEDVHKVEFRLNVANKIDVNLGLDCIFIGNEIVVNGGDSSNPIMIEDIANYSMNTRAGFPIGTVEMTGKLANIKSGIRIANSGYVQADNVYLLFNQLSNDVKHHVNIVEGVFEIGKNSNGKAIRGCQIVKPNGFSADFVVGSHGELKVYNSKFYRWSKIELGGLSEVNYVDFDNNGTVKFVNDYNDIYDIMVHDADISLYSDAITVAGSIGVIEKVLVYRCKNGVKFDSEAEIKRIELMDNSDYDIVIAEGIKANIIDSKYENVRRL